MKRITVILALTLTINLLNAQPFIEDVFNKYAGKSGLTSIAISPQIFKLLSAIDSSDPDLKIISEKVSGIRILVSEGQNMGFTNEIRDMIKNSAYLNIMEVIDGNQKVNFYAKQNGDKITDLLLLAIDDNEEVMLSITGNLELNELAKLGSTSKFGGNNSHFSLLKELEQ